MPTGYAVRQIMTTNVLTTVKSAAVSDCAKIMADKQVGSAVVCKDGIAIAILTEQDLARKVMAKDLDPHKTSVSDIMSTELFTISPDADIYDAMVKMGEHKVKHLPVLEANKLIGIVSFKDIIKIQPDLIDLMAFKAELNTKERKAVFAERTL